MSFDNGDDFYMRLKFSKPDVNGKYHTFLKDPITIKQGEKVSVCLVDIAYQNRTQFVNSKKFTWDLACPRLTGLNVTPPPPPPLPSVSYHRQLQREKQSRQQQQQEQQHQRQQQQQRRRQQPQQSQPRQYLQRKSFGGDDLEEEEEEEEEEMRTEEEEEEENTEEEEGVMDDYEEELIRDDPVYPDVKFLRMKLNDAENTIETLIRQINEEIVAKLDSRFKKNQCRFYYDRLLDRVQLTIDGSDELPENDRFSLLIYGDLVKALGFNDKKKSMSFGAPTKSLLPGQISQRSHSCAIYPPLISPTPLFCYVYLNIVQEHRVDNDFLSLLTVFPRAAPPNNGLDIYHIMNPRQYKRVAFNLTSIRELYFSISTEHLYQKYDLSNVFITLHFIKS